MSLLSRLHEYLEGGSITASDFNDEFNQILVTLGDVISGVAASRILITGFTDDENDAILEIKSPTNGQPLFIDTTANIALDGTLIISTGVLQIDSISTEFEVLSQEKCINLNADLLNSLEATDLQLALYGFVDHRVFYSDNTASANPDKPSFIVTDNGGKITKLKAKQDGVASANASTVLSFKKNGVEIGTTTITGNSTAVVTNDIADVVLEEDDLLTVSVTTYTGTTKHTDITAMFHIKKKFKI